MSEKLNNKAIITLIDNGKNVDINVTFDPEINPHSETQNKAVMMALMILEAFNQLQSEVEDENE